MHAVPVLRKRGGGCFVNIASTLDCGRVRTDRLQQLEGRGDPDVEVDGAEFGPDRIRVNCVNPVFSPDTALSAEFAGGALTEEAKKRFLATIPLGRFSTPLDVANAASTSPPTKPRWSAACASKSTGRAASRLS